jgi:ABC-type amino acid transport substrate-binding protein
MKKSSVYIIITLIAVVSAALWYRAKNTISISPSLDTVTVGINTEFPPFAFKQEDDTITGFDIDVITEVFKRLDKKITFKDLPFDALIPEIQIGNIHVIAAGMTPTEERALRTLFTRPHLTGNPLMIISLKNKPALRSLGEVGPAPTTLNDLPGKIVAVNDGYIADSYMSAQPHIEILRLSSALVSDGMLALESGRADAFVAASHSMKPYFEKHDINNYNVTPIPNTEETSAFAVSKHYPDLRYSIQNALDAMAEDGTLATLKKKWNLS